MGSAGTLSATEDLARPQLIGLDGTPIQVGTTDVNVQELQSGIGDPRDLVE